MLLSSNEALIQTQTQTSTIRRAEPPQALEMYGELSSEVLSLRSEIYELRALILSQNGLLEQLVQQQARIRVSRSQERALREAIRLRAGELAASERLPSRPVSQAIRKTVREITGCRALGDVPAEKYDQILGAVQGWYMPGALRRIRRRCGA